MGRGTGSAPLDRRSIRSVGAAQDRKVASGVIYLRSDGLQNVGRPYCRTSGTKDNQRNGVPLTLVVDVIASALRAEGVEMLSCYPTTPMIDAATRAGIRPVVCRQERVGVGIADGYSRLTAGDGFG